MIRSTAITSLLAILCLTDGASAVVRYVRADLATGANNGTSWANAFRGPSGLASALAAAQSGDDIWITAGTYMPGAAGNRAATFTLKNGVDLFGGFVGGETSLSQRNQAINPTILSGDLNNDDSGSTNLTDNAYHVVSATQSLSALCSGLTIRQGNANGPMNQNQDRGGALLLLGGANVAFEDCTLTTNRCTFGGGAGYINGAIAQFRRCTFTDNAGGTYGGAFDTNNATTTFVSCHFTNNSAWRAGALEVYGNSGNCAIINSRFHANIATGNNGGGALWIGNGGQATLDNATITANQALAAASGGVQSSSSISLRNSIVWGNTGATGTVAQQQLNASGTTSVSYSCMQGDRAGTGNTGSDPFLLVDGQLRWGSPCIDAANGLFLSGDIATDLGGKPRERDDPAKADTGISFQQRGVPDMGAFEFQRSSCVADISGSADAPDGAVTIDDLLAFLIAFEGGTLPADVDNGQSGGVPDEAVEISDLLYFLTRFEAGC